MTLRQKQRMARRVARQARVIDGIKWFFASLLGGSRAVKVVLQGRHVVLRTNTPDFKVAMSCFGGEFDELKAAVPTLDQGFIIDAGGYIGTAAIVLAEAYPNSTIVALEPSEKNFAILTRNVAAYPNIKALNKALAPIPGRLQLRDRGTGEWGFTLIAAPEDRPDSAVLDEVECTSVAELLADYGRSRVDIAKIDIEGGEHALLSEHTGWLKNTRAVCIELHDRIKSGCSDLWQEVTVGRMNSKMSGEKYLSVQAS